MFDGSRRMMVDLSTMPILRAILRLGCADLTV
jgi:hypothetical protein